MGLHKACGWHTMPRGTYIWPRRHTAWLASARSRICGASPSLIKYGNHRVRASGRMSSELGTQPTRQSMIADSGCTSTAPITTVSMLPHRTCVRVLRKPRGQEPQPDSHYERSQNSSERRQNKASSKRRRNTYTGKRTRLVYEARIVSKSRYEPRLRATPRKRVVYEPRALSSVHLHVPSISQGVGQEGTHESSCTVQGVIMNVMLLQ